MANIDKNDFIWNGKLSGAINLIYSDLLNVDIVRPPYSWMNRNSSFFLQTRLGYIVEESLYYHLKNDSPFRDHKNNWEVSDVQIIYDTNCSEESGTVYILVHNLDDDFRAIVTTSIEDGCVKFDFNYVRDRGWQTCGCGDWKLFKTMGPKGTKKNLLETGNACDGIQINKLEGGVYRGYFTTQSILDGTDTWGDIAKGDYLVITYSSNGEGDGFAGQTRMVTGFTTDMKYLVLDNAWNGFAAADENGNTYKVVMGENVCADAFGDWGEVIGVSRGSYIDLFYDGYSSIEYRPTLGCIISITESNGRLFALYDNGYIRYSKVGGRDQMFFDDEMDAGMDKTSIYAYKDFILAFGKRSISVGTPVEFNNTIYYTMYEQSGTMGLKSRFSYGEHDGNFIFVSNDNRLMALGVAATSGKYMLELEDIGQEIIGGKLSSMLDTDEAFIADYNNELRILVQTKANPIKESSKNSQTHIYKFDNYFKIWTEDHLSNILMKGYYGGIWYGQGGVYIRGLVEPEYYSSESTKPDAYNIVENGRKGYAIDFRDTVDLDVEDMPHKPEPVIAKIGAFMVENERTGLTQSSNGASTGAPDLFNLIKLNRLIVTLGYGSYSDEHTKIKITSYREGIGVVTEVKTFQTNDWINLISHSYMEEELPEELVEKKKCLLSAIKEGQTGYFQECSAKDLKVTDLITTKPRCEGSKKTNYQDHNICIDSSIFELAPHMPLTINVGDTQAYSSQVKVEIISEPGDMLNFGGLLAELFIAPFGTKGADGENLIQLSSC